MSVRLAAPMTNLFWLKWNDKKGKVDSKGMMVYNTQNYWDFGLCPTSGILESRKHNVSETGSVSVFR
jgi:hypothetical protein